MLRRGRGRRGPLGLLLAMAWLASPACNCEGQIAGSLNPRPPTVDDLPEFTNNPQLDVTGTRESDTSVWLHFERDADAARVAELAPAVDWSGTTTLREGDNTFVAFASSLNDAAFSAATDPITVILDTIPPPPPQVDFPFFIVEVMDGQTSAEVTISGTRESQTVIFADGVRAVGRRMGEIPFSFPTTRDIGIHEVVLTAEDRAGNVSDPTTVTVIVTDVPRPTLDPVTTPTNVTPQTLTGTRKGQTDLWRGEFDAATGTVTETLVQSGSGGESDTADIAWNNVLNLQEGDNIVWVFARRSPSMMGDLPSVYVNTPPDNIILDTIPPIVPILDDTPPSAGGSVTVTGRRGTDGNLCLRRTQEVTCTEIEPIDGTAPFSEIISLDPGQNFLCFSSFDAAGNQSGEVCRLINSVPGPNVVIVTPSQGDLVGGASIAVEATVTAQPVTGGDIDTVEVCLEGGACVTATQTGMTGTYTAMIDATGLMDGSTQTIIVTATSVNGVMTQASVTFTYSQSGAFLVSDSPVEEDARQVAAVTDGTGVIHIAWSDDCVQVGFGTGAGQCPLSQAGNLPGDIFYRTYTPSTSTFGAISLLSLGTGDNNSEQPSLVFDSNGTLHIAWQEERDVPGGTFDIHYATVTAGALGATEIISDSVAAASDQLAKLAAGADGSVHVVWDRTINDTDHDIIYRRKPMGMAWGPEVVITDDAGDGDSRRPAVAVDSAGTAYVVWHDDGDIATLMAEAGDNDIFLRTVSSAGVPAAPVLISDNALDGTQDSASTNARVVMDSTDRLHIVWEDTIDLAGSGSDPDIWHRSYQGTTKSVSYVLVSNGSNGGASEASIVVSGDDLFVVWAERDSGLDPGDIRFNVGSRGDPSAFGTPRVLAATAESSFGATATVTNATTAFVLWEDTTGLGGNDTADDSDIYMKPATIAQ